jgi:hypothetical protein
MRAATLLPLVLVLVEGANRLEHPVAPRAPAGFSAAAGPVLVLPSDLSFDFFPMLWSTDRFPKMTNGISGFTPKDQVVTRDMGRFFPDPSSVAYLHGLGVRSVVVVKDRVGKAYARAAAPDPSMRGLGVTWQDYGDTIVYKLS